MITLLIDVGGGQIQINETQGRPWSGRTESAFGSIPDYQDPQRFVSEDLAALGVEAELTYTGICG